MSTTRHFLRLSVVLIIALAAFFAAWAISLSGRAADDFFYDAFYRLRAPQDMTNSDVVLVAVDDASLTASGKPWPWPRTYWGDICTYLDHAGAKVIAFDIVFPNPSYYGDDPAFAQAMNKLHTPVVYGSEVSDVGDWGPFAPKEIKQPTFGAVNLGNSKIYRAYPPELSGQPSLAEMSAVLAGLSPDDLQKNFSPLDQKFLLRYYGPHLLPNGNETFRFVPAYPVVMAQTDPQSPLAKGISPSLFRGKIVIICAIALGTFDLKASPLSAEYPGPEVQATAIENMLHAQQVHPLPHWIVLLAALLSSLVVTTGVVYPRQALLKVLAPILITIALFALCIFLFRAQNIRWMTPTPALLTILIASPLAFGWTYFTEDRQRRFMLKALSKVVSPAVAQQLAREPQRLALGTVRAQITVLFTDLANFTDLSEGMDVQELGKLLNRYLGEMSNQVFSQDGTLDKYIGDAVMAFWNAPLPQADHTLRACRAALRMINREKELHAEFTALGTRRIFTRVGINTTTVAVGFIGSEHLFNYTALGDGVNLASRLEGANKLYGTQILLSESTADLVRDHFLLRRIDVLRVKGKKQPMPVYELLAGRDGAPSPDLEERIHGYESAFAFYQSRNWSQAEQLLLELSTRFGDDAAIKALLARVQDFRRSPPPPEWDGVYVSTTK